MISIDGILMDVECTFELYTACADMQGILGWASMQLEGSWKIPLKMDKF